MNPNMWNQQLESISEVKQRTFERDKLISQLDYIYSESPFYHSKLAEVGIRPSDVQSIEDLAGLPFTYKSELRDSQERHPPFGDYLATSRESVTTVHRTSGSTGKFIYAVLTDQDMDQTNECGARAFWSAGLRPHHTAIHCLNYSLWMGGYTDHRNLAKTGAGIIPFGVGNSRQLVRTIMEIEVDAISCTPSYPAYLAGVVRSELGVKPSDLGLELGLFGGEPGLEDKSFKNRMEDTWGFRAKNANYGMAEVLCNFASVCDQRNELHFLGQGAVLPEIIDPATGEAISLEKGSFGELVLTNIDRQAQPLMRYRTHDLVTITGTGPCSCERTGFRFKVSGRSDDMVHVKGINVFPSAIAGILNLMTPELNGEFQIVLSQPGPYDLLEILVESDKHRGQGTRALKIRIENEIKDTLGFKSNIQLISPGTIPRTQVGKTTRVVRKF